MSWLVMINYKEKSVQLNRHFIGLPNTKQTKDEVEAAFW